MKKIFAFSALVLILASLVGCSSTRALPRELGGAGSLRDVVSVNSNAYARSQADALDRALDLTRQQYRKVFKAYYQEIQDLKGHVESAGDDRLDRSYIREHGRLERKMKRILTAEQYARWRRLDGGRWRR